MNLTNKSRTQSALKTVSTILVWLLIVSGTSCCSSATIEETTRSPRSRVLQTTNNNNNVEAPTEAPVVDEGFLATISPQPTLSEPSVAEATFRQTLTIGDGRQFSDNQIALLQGLYAGYTSRFVVNVGLSVDAVTEGGIITQCMVVEQVGTVSSEEGYRRRLLRRGQQRRQRQRTLQVSANETAPGSGTTLIQAVDIQFTMSYTSPYHNISNFPVYFQNWVNQDLVTVTTEMQQLSLNVTEALSINRVIVRPTIEPTFTPTIIVPATPEPSIIYASPTIAPTIADPSMSMDKHAVTSITASAIVAVCVVGAGLAFYFWRRNRQLQPQQQQQQRNKGVSTTPSTDVSTDEQPKTMERNDNPIHAAGGAAINGIGHAKDNDKAAEDEKEEAKHYDDRVHHYYRNKYRKAAEKAAAKEKAASRNHRYYKNNNPSTDEILSHNNIGIGAVPTPSSRTEDIKQRLRRLDKLRDVITMAEYEQRRLEILSEV